MPVAARPNHDRWRAVSACVSAAAAFGFSLSNRSRCCRRILSTSARAGASVPRPHATSPTPAALAHAARARSRRPGGPVPGPDSSLRNNRSDTGHPLERPRGPGPVQGEHQGHPLQLGPAVITSHPRIVAQAARACQAPGLPLPRRCRPAGPGRRRCPGPAASALAPRRSSAQPGSPGRAAGPVSPPAPPCGSTRTGDSSSNPRDPIHYEFNLGNPPCGGSSRAARAWPLASADPGAGLHREGLRWGEATALRVCDIDFDRRRIDVRRAFSDVGGHVVLGTPKSHQSRTVPLPRFVAAELAAGVDGKRPDDLVFTMPGGSVMRLSNWRLVTFKPARTRAGLSDRFRIHDLRHTAASQFPGGLPAQDAPGDHGSCQHHHDPGPVREPCTRERWTATLTGSMMRPPKVMRPKCGQTRTPAKPIRRSQGAELGKRWRVTDRTR